MRRSLAVFSAVLLTAGCADKVTSPAPAVGGVMLDATPSGCVSDGTCPIDGVIVIGQPGTGGGSWSGGGGGGGSDGGDDPGDGQCMTSYADHGATVQGCDGGGGDPYDPPPSEECDPRIDPDCEQPLTSADSTTLATALANYVRPASAIADTTARRQCQEMLTQFNASYAAGNVFRGGSNTSHYGATYLDRIHFDPEWLDAAAAGDATALREIANTALHEAAHVLGYDHPNGATWSGGQDYYSDPPFNLLSPGPNSCIQY